ncbi:hypothetical protein [Parasitella parasitica]|uniref:C2H2-type domain-containing protein n=1 Tax=Parasitella parasitica TaxID=35722 RepID=A0A0B7NKC1_9FUNG|nr:hypothetical protein [Parasitella parasitica]
MTAQHQNQWKESRSSSSTSIPSLLNEKPPNATHLPTPDEQDSNTKTVAEKPFVCKQCNQSFSRSHNLKSHLATHSPEKPFQCDTCNHLFRRQHDLKRHQKLHTGERPYVCTSCSRSFARLDALSRHQSAYGGTACSSNHHRNSIIAKVVPLHLKTGNSNTTSPPQHPTIPHINIDRPSSLPVSSPPLLPLTSSPTSINASPQQQALHLSLPPLRSNSLSSCGTSPSLIQFKLTDDALSSSSQPPFRSWSYPTNMSLSSPPSPHTTRILPSINDHVLLQQQIKHLEHENTTLKQELNQVSLDKQHIHDLEVENKLLKSLILDQSQPQDRKRLNDVDGIDLLKKVKYERE